MKKSILPLVAVATTFSLIACSSSYSQNDNSMSGKDSMQTVELSPEALELKQAMRKLWSDHVIWTRQYIVAAVAGSPDAEAVANRLLKNQDDIGNAIVPYYGGDAGKRLGELLREHILIAVDLVAGAKAGDDTKMEDADARWHKNAEDIAIFLSTANPNNWSKEEMVHMLNEHLALTTQEAVARLEGNWTEDISTFDSIFIQALGMADGLSAGIIKQFPEKF